jgi:hypothetical protein
LCGERPSTLRQGPRSGVTERLRHQPAAVRSPPACLNSSHSVAGCTTSTTHQHATLRKTLLRHHYYHRDVPVGLPAGARGVGPAPGFGYPAQHSTQRVSLRCGPDQVQHSARAAHHRRPDLRPHHRAPNRSDLPLRTFNITYIPYICICSCNTLICRYVYI